MRLLLIRHGQMEIRASQAADVAALNRLFSAEVQGGLTERGRAEAGRVARLLAGRRIDAVMASPLMRAQQTARVTAEALGLDVAIHGGLTELRTGGLPAGTRAARLIDSLARSALPVGAKRALLSAISVPLYYDRWQRGLTEGGESPAEFHGRVDALFRELRERHAPDASVALFAHGYLIFTLSLRLSRSMRQRASVWRRPYIPNGAVTEIDLSRDGVATMIRYAEASHLVDRP
jgi:broad specificity phosphatase PhoE